MSSFVRRLERLVKPSHKVHPIRDLDSKIIGYESNPPRAELAAKRNCRLGVTNPKAKDLLARKAREEKRNARA